LDYKSKITEKLTEEFSPKFLKVIDESESHRGHSGFIEGQQTHFQIQIASDIFEEMSRIKREREIHKALGKEIIGNIHALSIKFL
tara:strand:+ start:88 stop:342 length:255 start_codon:yes stop_codon:yes gene_type:complete